MTAADDRRPGVRHAGEPCQPPDPNPHPPAFRVPPHACDTHAHVIADPALYPYVAERSYTPALAGLGSYLALLSALRLDRGVVIQPSIYGTDNRLLLDVLAAHPSRLRGVAVVDPDAVSDDELQRLDAAGVRGARLNLLYPGAGYAIDRLETLAARIAPLGWHLQLLIKGSAIPALAARLRRLPVACVFDHLAHLPVDFGPGDEAVPALLALLEAGRTYVKLSGANRVSLAGPPYADTRALASLFARVAPERCLWGSDWPHVAMSEPMLNTGDLFNLLPLWVPDEAARHRILVDNPSRLYQFPPPPGGIAPSATDRLARA